MVGFTESANLPMRGIVHLSPGKCPFFCLYTDCSRISSPSRIAPVVAIHVAAGLVEKVTRVWTGMREAAPVEEGMDTGGDM